MPVRPTILPILVLLALRSGMARAEPQILADFFHGKAHLIDNDIMDDAHTVEIALAAGSSGLMNLRAILISRWVPYENRWNAVVQQAWAAMIRTAAIKDGFANVPPIYPGVPLGMTSDQRIPASQRIEDTVPFKTPAAYKIVEEARDCTARNPLIVIVGGRATCVADAYLIDPTIADKVIVAQYLDYVGDDGHLPGYNIQQDMWAANIVLKNFRVVAAYPENLYEYAPEVYLNPGSDADRDKMPGTYLEDLMCLKPHPLLRREHGDGDGHGIALLQVGVAVAHGLLLIYILVGPAGGDGDGNMPMRLGSHDHGIQGLMLQQFPKVVISRHRFAPPFRRGLKRGVLS